MKTEEIERIAKLKADYKFLSEEDNNVLIEIAKSKEDTQCLVECIFKEHERRLKESKVKEEDKTENFLAIWLSILAAGVLVFLAILCIN